MCRHAGSNMDFLLTADRDLQRCGGHIDGGHIDGDRVDGGHTVPLVMCHTDVPLEGWFHADSLTYTIEALCAQWE